MKVNIGVSARHVHLTREDIDVLFGKEYILTKKNDLSQPGQYACEEQVIIRGEKDEISGVRILGPEREKTQVEVSKTDARKLGINPPIRLSGHLSDACKITIIGPHGQITRDAAIIAARHIHVTKKEAEDLGIYGKDKVSFKVLGERGGIMNEVYVRVSEKFKCEIHVDTDEANAFSIGMGDKVDLIIND